MTDLANKNHHFKAHFNDDHLTTVQYSCFKQAACGALDHLKKYKYDDQVLKLSKTNSRSSRKISYLTSVPGISKSTVIINMNATRSSQLSFSEMDAFFNKSIRSIEKSRKIRASFSSVAQKKRMTFAEKRKIHKIDEYRIRRDVYNNNFQSISSLFKKILSIGCSNDGTPV